MGFIDETNIDSLIEIEYERKLEEERKKKEIEDFNIKTKQNETTQMIINDIARSISHNKHLRNRSKCSFGDLLSIKKYQYIILKNNEEILNEIQDFVLKSKYIAEFDIRINEFIAGTYEIDYYYKFKSNRKNEKDEKDEKNECILV